MTELDRALHALRAHDGVEQLFLVGMDGLLVRHIGDARGPSPDTVAAMAPGVATAAASFARAAGSHEASTAVLELDRAVAIVTTLSADLLLAVLVRPGVGFAALLRELRRERGRLADLL